MIPPVLPTYARNELAFVRGEGPYLFTADQRRFLDFASGIAVTSLGHSHPHLVKTLQEQAARLWHTANLVHIPDQQRLAERLVARTFADTAFFCNSGAEALECAVKMARRYHSQGGPQNRYRVITFNGAFHGRTLATIAAGGQSKHLAGFAPAVDGFDHVPFGNLNALRDAIGADTAAILVEPVQGEGGIIPADASFLRGLREAADEFGLLLIFDEVQTGMGRTGTLFAYEHSGITPDIMAVAKGLGGGFPVAACLATERAASAMTTGTHGSTFGGNPLAMAVANAVLDVMEAEGFLDHVNHVASILRQGLADLASRYPTVIGKVRGLGLMLGLVLPAEVTNTTFIDHARRQGLLCVGAGHNAVRLLPPLIVEETHIAESLGILDATCAALLPSEQRTVP